MPCLNLAYTLVTISVPFLFNLKVVARWQLQKVVLAHHQDFQSRSVMILLCCHQFSDEPCTTK